MNKKILLVLPFLAIFPTSPMAFQEARPARERPVSRVGMRTLESDLNKIDIASRGNDRNVEVDIKGHDESTGTMKIRVLRQPSIPDATGGGEPTAENTARVRDGA